jgi:hypothetical protein
MPSETVNRIEIAYNQHGASGNCGSGVNDITLSHGETAAYRCPFNAK